MKLELKHLSGYLPYKLIMEILDFPLSKVLGKHYRILELDCGHDFHFYFSQNRVRPILTPISDLEKIIENEFSKLDDFKSSEYSSEVIELFCFENIGFEEELSTYDLSKLPYECVEFMFKNHYDFFGLIEKGLAISIHDVEQADA